MPRLNLPAKAPLPEKKFFCNQRYFDVGDTIKFESRSGGRSGEGKITKIKVNHYHRVSYYVGEQLVFIEDIMRAMFPTTTHGP